MNLMYHLSLKHPLHLKYPMSHLFLMNLKYLSHP
jgi:hypothetical protein